MGNFFVKFPSFSDLKNAKPTTPNPAVPAPKTWFNLDLRIVLMVILGAYAIYNLVVVILTIPWLWNPFVWVLFLLEVVNLLLNGFGFWAVYRLIPEWMVMYGWFILIFLVVRVVEVVTYVILGAAASSITKLIFAVLFTISMIACLFSLRAYAQACRGLSI